MEFIGKISIVEQPVSGTSQTGAQWTRQEFVVEGVQGSYPEKYVLSLSGQERIANTNLQVGQIVRVQFEGHARESKGRWFNALNAFNVQPVTFGQQGVTPAQPVAAPQQSPQPGQYMQNYQQVQAQQQAQAATQMYSQATQMQGQQVQNNLPFG